MIIQLSQKISSIVAGVEIKMLDGYPLLNLRSDSQGVTFGPYSPDSKLCISIKVPGLPFYPGVYAIEPWFAESKGKRIDHIHEGINITLETAGNFDSELMIQQGRGVMLMDCDWFDEVDYNYAVN